MIRKIFVFIFCIVFLINMNVPAFARVGTVFTDVPKDYWAAGKISFAVKKNWLYGYSDLTFRPTQEVTRAELAALLAKTSGETPLYPETPSFTDVSYDQWFYSPVETASKFFINDHSLDLGLFRPNDFATRQEAAAAMAVLKKYNSTDDPSQLQSVFSDYQSISPEYRYGVLGAVKNGIISGYSDGTFRPDALLTRAEAVSLIFTAFFNDITTDGLIISGNVKPFDKSDETFVSAESFLDSHFSDLDGVELKFYVKELPLHGSKDDKLILVFGRVDPFKYFSFSEAVFTPNPNRTVEYAQSIVNELSKTYPERRIMALVGFSNLTFYSTTPEIYGGKYTYFSESEGGWRVERFYAAALGRDGQITDTWLDSGE